MFNVDVESNGGDWLSVSRVLTEMAVSAKETSISAAKDMLTASAFCYARGVSGNDQGYKLVEFSYGQVSGVTLWGKDDDGLSCKVRVRGEIVTYIIKDRFGETQGLTQIESQQILNEALDGFWDFVKEKESRSGL